MTDHSVCTITFAFITAMACFVCSLPRTFSGLSKIATFSAIFTFISILLVVVFAGIGFPYTGGKPVEDPIVRIIPAPGTSFAAGLGAFLNISFVFIGQITLPSFIAEMKEPKDFWKSVTVVTIAEIVLFSVIGALVYAFTGSQYIQDMAFSSLGNDLYMKVSFSFMVPTLLFLGVLYASVSARFIFFRLFDGTDHVGNHTFVGWASWAAILLVLWILAWVVAEVIPFFNSLLSIMGSVFGSFFGFIFWGVAGLRLSHADYGSGFYKTRGFRGWVDLFAHVSLILIGLFFLGPGTYVRTDPDLNHPFR
ncbi:hypothetical protein N7448_002773 [Penicillium atrosanguineum]|uniref:Amino acid transporter transmembrane domain-containing protein n=1 Tax=Penicillium atrosanguineum TaxID=1132637 RepID=A0A9W9PWK6_9EURO|nr:hypothetical protein N7526_007227 [Penicillium atrosanguineum]KAJ5145381.1 hypothetical protein N7448_002773 [Penicillium atrosanguineum]KAJ5311819.1 hypothetical protein N7476_007679 [Penicillium atrosanguineum]